MKKRRRIGRWVKEACGRWVDKEDGSYCSECGREAMLFINGVGDPQMYRSPYCPHCGAYMWGYGKLVR